MRLTIPQELRADHGLFLSGGEPLVFHCHHYNVALQKAIEEGLGDDAAPLFMDAAAEVGHRQMSDILAANPKITDFSERLAIAAELSRMQGFGVFEVRGNADGGTAESARSHYAAGWRAKNPPRDRPVCAYHAGYFAGAFSAAAGTAPGRYEAEETSCGAVTNGPCRFTIRKTQKQPRAIPRSVGIGTLPPRPAPPIGTTGNVRSQAVIDALRSMTIVGNEEGLIPAFGVYLTRHYANYYNRISYAFEERLERELPALTEASRLALIEAGHICAFYTFGGIAASPEWEGLIMPMCRDRVDWFHGFVACANALGWGSWRTTTLEPGERAVIDLYATYESNGRLAMYGATDHASCYLATGGLAGFMNLLWVGDITKRPRLDEGYYSHIYAQEESFVGEEVQCRSKGDPHCRVVVTRRRF